MTTFNPAAYLAELAELGVRISAVYDDDKPRIVLEVEDLQDSRKWEMTKRLFQQHIAKSEANRAALAEYLAQKARNGDV